jgi:hypothetical protein
MSFWTKATRPAPSSVTAPTMASRLRFEVPIWKPSKNTL